MRPSATITKRAFGTFSADHVEPDKRRLVLAAHAAEDGDLQVRGAASLRQNATRAVATVSSKQQAPQCGAQPADSPAKDGRLVSHGNSSSVIRQVDDDAIPFPTKEVAGTR
jgi:hypothetical protein